MTYKVRLTFRAREDARESASYLRVRSPESARQWMNGLRKLQEGLAIFPLRFPKVPEAENLHYDYREALHYSHRVIFYVNDENKTVHIVRIYHSARKPLELEE